MENNQVTVRARIAFPSLDKELIYKGAPTGKYSVQLANLSGPAVEKLEELGVTIKYPLIYEADGKTVFEDATSSIGYGTVVRATVRPYSTPDGVKPSLVRLAIEELHRPEVAMSDEEDTVL